MFQRAVEPSLVALDSRIQCWLRIKARALFAAADPHGVVIPGQPIELRRIDRDRRKFTAMFRYRLRRADRDLDVFVKCPQTQPIRAFDAAPPPTLHELENDGQKEFAALSVIHAHLESLGDPRFGAFRPLGWIESERALVLEAQDHPTLLEVLRGHLRRGASASDPAPLGLLESTGAWLAQFHGLPPLHAEQEAFSTRDRFLETLEESLDPLMGLVGQRRLLQEVRRGTRAASRQFLPTVLERTRQHSDFAAHNIFVGPERRVTVFDTRADECGPPVRDLAYFVQQLRATLRLDRAFVDPALGASWERALLRGYSPNAPCSLGALRLFEAEVWVRKWLQARESVKRARWLWKVPKWSRLKLREVTYSRALRRILSDLDSAPAKRTVQRQAPRQPVDTR